MTRSKTAERHALLLSAASLSRADAVAKHGPEYRDLLGAVFDVATGLPLDQGLGVALILNGAGVAVGFSTTGENGEAVPVRYDAPGALGKTRSMLQASNKGLGARGKTPEEGLVRHLRRGLLDAMAPEAARLMPDKADGSPSKGAIAWRRKNSLRLANMVGRAVVAECMANAIGREQTGPLHVLRRHAPSLRAPLASAILPQNEDARRRSQLVAQCAVAALVPFSLAKAAGKKLRDVVSGLLKLPPGAKRIKPEGVAVLARHLRTEGLDLDPESIKWLSADLLKALPAQGYKQRLVLDTSARVWQASREDGFVERVGLWLSATIAKDVASPHAFRLEAMTPVVDWLLVDPVRVAELRELFAPDAPELASLSALDTALSIQDALDCARAVATALGLEESLVQRRMLATHKADVRAKHAARLKQLAQPIPAPNWAPSDGPLPGSVWSLVRLATEAEIIDEGRRQHHCVGTWIEKARAGTVAVYSIRRPPKKGDKGERVSTDPKGQEFVCGGTIAFGWHDGRLRIVEFRGAVNGPPLDSAAAAINRKFPNA